jgi:citrate lyase subunit beta/citryl-CoA lyase
MSKRVREHSSQAVLRRSQLYVPANVERMITKASKLEADSVVFDLEDSVPSQSKEEARSLIRRVLNELDWGSKEVCVRINPLTSLDSYRDLLAVSYLDRVDTLVVPKADVGIGMVYRATGKPLIPIVETARGLLRIEDIAAEQGVVALTWGAADMAFSFGGSVDAFSSNICVRTKVAATAAAHGLDALDKVYFDVTDIEGFTAEAREAKKYGFCGKQVIHPNQIAPANAVFSPTVEEIEWAQRILSAYEEGRKAGKGAVRVGDELVDEVHVRIAERIILRAANEPRRSGNRAREGAPGEI